MDRRFRGAAVLADNRTVFAPYNADCVGLFDPAGGGTFSCAACAACAAAVGALLAAGADPTAADAVGQTPRQLAPAGAPGSAVRRRLDKALLRVVVGGDSEGGWVSRSFARAQLAAKDKPAPPSPRKHPCSISTQTTF